MVEFKTLGGPWKTIEAFENGVHVVRLRRIPNIRKWEVRHNRHIGGGKMFSRLADAKN